MQSLKQRYDGVTRTELIRDHAALIEERKVMYQKLQTFAGFLTCLVAEKGEQTIDIKQAEETKKKNPQIIVRNTPDSFICSLFTEKKDSQTAQESTQLCEKEVTQ